MTVTANSSGVVNGSFSIPSGIPAGAQLVEFAGSGGSKGSAVFVGSGTITDQTLQQVTTQTQIFYVWDPVAQTFSVPNQCQIGGIDLWFSVRGTKPVVVQIRETAQGFPTQGVLASKQVTAASLSTTTNSRILFDAPVNLLPGVEYALVVLTDDAATAVSIAQLGQWDSVHQQWVTSQPYQIGTLLTSSNARTWTASQDKDLTFRLLAATFTSNTRTIALGSVAVTAATDLILSALEETPSSATRIAYTLTLPDGSVIQVAKGQPVKLAAAVTGNIAISATLIGTSTSSPVLVPGTQLIVGAVAASATYVTRAVPGGSSVRVKAVFDALVPAGSSVTVHYTGDGGTTWTLLPNTGSASAANGYVTLTHQATGINAAQVALRLTLAGTPAARPDVRNLKFMTI